MKRQPGFLQVPLAGPGMPANMNALLFYGADDDELVAKVKATQLTSPSLRVTHDTARPPSVSGTSIGISRPKLWFQALVLTAITIALLIAPLLIDVKSVAGVLGGAALFGAGAALMWWILWRTRRA